MTRFLDTNILLYSISNHRDETAKREIAVKLLGERDNALSVQVLQEFYVQATRATRADALPHDIAVGLIRAWLRFPVQDITLPVMSGALDIKARRRALLLGCGDRRGSPRASAAANFSRRTWRTAARSRA